MPKHQLLPFKCPNCAAPYQVEGVEVGPENDREITCLTCGGPLAARNGQFALKYFLMRRSGEFKRPTYTVV